MHVRDGVGCVRMCVVLARPPMCRPTRMADTDIAAERLSLQPRFQRLQFTFGTPTSKDAVVECGDAPGQRVRK